MKKQMKQTGVRLITLIAVFVLFCANPLTALAYPGTVAGTGNVNVRSQTNTSSDVVTSLTGGSTIEIEGEELDASNQTWYKITVNGQTGYIRADLVNTDGAGNANAGTSTSTAATGASTTTPAAATTATSVAERKATVNTDQINIRSGAGRDYNQVTTLALNTEVTVTGEANASDGAKWYRIRFNGTQEGYVLADFLDLGDPVEPDPAETGATDDAANAATTDVTATPPVTEAPDATETDGMMGKQYTVSYETDDTGEEQPWLVDHNSNAKWNVLSLIGDYEELVRLQSVKRTNTILKIVCAVLAILTIAAFILLFLASSRFRRMQDGNYESEEDDEEDDGYDRAGRRSSYDDDDEDDDYDDEEDDDYEDEAPRKKKGGGFFARFRKKKRYEDEEDEEDYDDEDDYDDEPPRAIRRVYSPERPAYDEGDRGGVVMPQGAARKPRNFMEDDDDFDYSFMNDD